MKIETIVWLLPVVFMIHDFEEIIMIPLWLEKNREEVLSRFPKLGNRMLAQFGKLSGTGFTVAVLEEFVFISLLTLLAAENSWYNLWTGLMLVFFLHLFLHVGQFLVFRKYIPAIVTSVLSMIYCLYALNFMVVHKLIFWPDVMKWFVIFLILVALNLMIAHRLGAHLNQVLVRNRKNNKK